MDIVMNHERSRCACSIWTEFFHSYNTSKLVCIYIYHKLEEWPYSMCMQYGTRETSVLLKTYALDNYYITENEEI